MLYVYVHCYLVDLLLQCLFLYLDDSKNSSNWSELVKTFDLDKTSLGNLCVNSQMVGRDKYCTW